MHHTQNWRELASIQIGAVICLPMLLVGYELARAGETSYAFSSICIGNAILTLIGIVAALMSCHYKTSTAQLGRRFLGVAGGWLPALLLVLAMSGWFAIQTQTMSRDLAQALDVGVSGSWGEITLRLLLVMAIVAVGLMGLKGITWMADLSIPLMLGIISYALYFASTHGEGGIEKLQWGFSASGVSLVMAAYIVGVVDLPTFFQHALSRRDAILAALLTFGVAVPLVELAGVCLYQLTHAVSLSQALMIVPHPIWKVCVLFFLFLAGWTTNNANLYSAGMNLSAVRAGMKSRTALLLAGALALPLACVDLLSYFSQVLDAMGVAIAAMGGAMLMSYLCEPAGTLDVANKGIWPLLAWLSGALFGLWSIVDRGGVSGGALLDAFAISAAAIIASNAVAWAFRRLKSFAKIPGEIYVDLI